MGHDRAWLGLAWQVWVTQDEEPSRLRNYRSRWNVCGMTGPGWAWLGKLSQDKVFISITNERVQKVIHQKSVDTKVIESVLAEAKVGDIVTYAELSKAIGRDVREHAMSALGTARRGVLADKGMVFGTRKNVGVQRLNDEGIIKSTESDRRSLQRRSKRSLRKLEVVKYAELPDEMKRQHVVASAQLGAIAMFASAASTKKIDSKVTPSTANLPIGETLKLFS